MYKYYFNIAVRLLLKNKLFSTINIGGLTVGLMASFLIIMFVKSETGYDQWIPNHENIYTIETLKNAPGRAPDVNARTPRELKAAMEKDFSEIKDFTRFYAGTAPLKIGNTPFPEKTFRIEETFFNVFDLPFVAGSSENALDLAGSLIITERLAEKYFSGQDALGQTVSIGDDVYNVSGVLENLPFKTHLDFDALIFDGPGALNNDFIDWTSSRLYSYFTLNEGAVLENIIAGTPDFLDRNAFFAPESWQDFRPSEVMGLSYMPIADIHLYQNGRNPIKPSGSATLIYGFIALSILIIAMASINFINLSTATSSTREKEIAIHKVVGARKGQLMSRYLIEALALVIISCVLALLITSAVSSVFFGWLGFNVEDGVSDIALIAIGTSLVSGLLAGIYPAFHLSSKSPSSAISGGRSISAKTAKFRIGLMFFQYTVSIILVIASAHFYLQTRHASTMDLGFSDDHVVSYWGVSGAPNEELQQGLIERVRQIPGVTSVTRMAQVPGSNSQNNVTLWPISDDSSNIRIQSVAAGVDFDKTMDMTLIAGRSFEAGRDIDKMTEGKEAPASIVINELALNALGFQNPDDAIGMTYRMKDYFYDEVLVEIIGVVRNAHFQTIHSEMTPMLFPNAEDFFNAMVVKIDGNNQETLKAIDEIWPTYIPDVAVYKTFLTDDLASQYTNEKRQTQIYGGFATLAVLIALMGIFGLAAYNVDRRTKEVGIRKVFGATVMDIVKLFIWQFSKPIMWATLAAWPLAAYGINEWLQGYAYRIDMMPLIFISAAVSILLVSWATIASQAARVAMATPVNALRYE